MPAWIHDRAKHLRDKNPKMPESMSWALATQQAYATGKAPKSYGTKTGRREAKQKYDEPKSEYKKTADPGSKSKSAAMDLAFLMGFSDEMLKIAMASTPAELMKSIPQKSTLFKMPKQIAKPAKDTGVLNVKDPLSSTRTQMPPPVTGSSL